MGLEELSIEKVRFSRPALEPENALNARTYETMFVKAGKQAAAGVRATG